MSKQKEGKLLYLSPAQLITHPKNLRRFYPDEDVREMAESIKATKGLIQPMRIVKNGQKGKYFVVDGNMRLAGARVLGKNSPMLKCELVNEKEADQLLAMVVTAKFRFAPDAISEALHYRRIMKEEKYSVKDIASLTGLHEVTVENRLALLELDEEIQELIANKKLPTSRRIVTAFMSINNKMARVKLAERLAESGSTVTAIEKSCKRLVKQLDETEVASSDTPAIDIAGQKTFGRKLSQKKKVPMQKIRKSAKEMCEKCDIRESSLAEVHEPAWSLIAHAADETCGSCSVRGIFESCGECPAVDILRRIIVGVGSK